MSLFGWKPKPKSALPATYGKDFVRSNWSKNCDAMLDSYLDREESINQLKLHLKHLYPNNAEAMTDNLLTLNLLRKVVDQKAKLYRKTPQRKLLTKNANIPENTDQANLVLANIVNSCRLNTKMKWLLKIYELLNSAILWGQIDFEKQVPSLSILPPNRLMIEIDPDNPLDLQSAIAIYVPLAIDQISGSASGYVRYKKVVSKSGVCQLVVEKLDADYIPIINQPAEFEAYLNLKDYPFLLLRKNDFIDAELFPDISHSLLNASKWLDHELTRGALNSRQTDFPAYVFNGTPNELGTVNPVTGAGSIICLGDDEKELKSLAVDPREKERNQNLQFFLKTFAQLNDITPSAFSFDNNLLSGTAKFHDKQAEIEYREDQISLLKSFEEEELWPMLKSLAQLAGMYGAEMLEDIKISVDFPDQVIPLSREEELKNLECEIRLGIKSAADYLTEHQGISHEQAKEKVKQNLASIVQPTLS